MNICNMSQPFRAYCPLKYHSYLKISCFWVQVCLNMCEQEGLFPNIAPKSIAIVARKESETVKIMNRTIPQQTHVYKIFIHAKIEILNNR